MHGPTCIFGANLTPFSLKGAEDIERYVGCGQTFLDIGNIHAMRHSVDTLAELMAAVDAFEDKEERWLSDLSGTHWLYHTRLV